MSQPSCIILGGPNGSGKSSAYAKLQLEVVWINADEIAKELTGSSDGRAAAMAAGRAALLKIREMIETRQSFDFETYRSRASIDQEIADFEEMLRSTMQDFDPPERK